MENFKKLTEAEFNMLSEEVKIAYTINFNASFYPKLKGLKSFMPENMDYSSWAKLLAQDSGLVKELQTLDSKLVGFCTDDWLLILSGSPELAPCCTDVYVWHYLLSRHPLLASLCPMASLTSLGKSELLRENLWMIPAFGILREPFVITLRYNVQSPKIVVKAFLTEAFELSAFCVDNIIRGIESHGSEVVAVLERHDAEQAEAKLKRLNLELVHKIPFSCQSFTEKMLESQMELK
jgi:hypothetical protein